MAHLAKTKVSVKHRTFVPGGKHFIELDMKNTGRTLSFFTQVQWLDGEGKPVRPSFYTDNFICLMPGEHRRVEIETDMGKLPDDQYLLVVRGFNTDRQEFRVKVR